MRFIHSFIHSFIQTKSSSFSFRFAYSLSPPKIQITQPKDHHFVYQFVHPFNSINEFYMITMNESMEWRRWNWNDEEIRKKKKKE